MKTALADVEVEGVRLDLHRKLRLVGLTYGIEPTTATLGWAAVEDLSVIRAGQAVAVNGLALHFTGLSRFEVSLQEEPPGQLDYFELRQDPEMTLVFFFEGGTLRISADECRAELVTESADEEAPDPGTEPGSGGGLVQ
ncbi:MAG: hypothetical protein ACRD01_08020 [Terriglobales bacterium]